MSHFHYDTDFASDYDNDTQNYVNHPSNDTTNDTYTCTDDPSFHEKANIEHNQSQQPLQQHAPFDGDMDENENVSVSVSAQEWTEKWTENKSSSTDRRSTSGSSSKSNAFLNVDDNSAQEVQLLDTTNDDIANNESNDYREDFVQSNSINTQAPTYNQNELRTHLFHEELHCSQNKYNEYSNNNEIKILNENSPLKYLPVDIMNSIEVGKIKNPSIKNQDDEDSKSSEIVLDRRSTLVEMEDGSDSFDQVQEWNGLETTEDTHLHLDIIKDSSDLLVNANIKQENEATSQEISSKVSNQQSENDEIYEHDGSREEKEEISNHDETWPMQKNLLVANINDCDTSPSHKQLQNMFPNVNNTVPPMNGPPVESNRLDICDMEKDHVPPNDSSPNKAASLKHPPVSSAAEYMEKHNINPPLTSFGVESDDFPRSIIPQMNEPNTPILTQTKGTDSLSPIRKSSSKKRNRSRKRSFQNILVPSSGTNVSDRMDSYTFPPIGNRNSEYTPTSPELHSAATSSPSSIASPRSMGSQAYFPHLSSISIANATPKSKIDNIYSRYNDSKFYNSWLSEDNSPEMSSNRKMVDVGELIMIQNESESKNYQIEILERKIKELKSTIVECTENIQLNKQSIKKLNLDLNRSQRRNKELEAQLQSSENHTTNLERTIRELNFSQARIKDYEIILDRRNSRMNEEYNSMKSFYEEKIKVLEANNEDIRIALQRKQENEETLKNNIARMNSIIENKDMQINILQEQIKAQKTRVDYLSQNTQGLFREKHHSIREERDRYMK